MSKYTTEVRFICESYAGETESQGSSKVEEIISKARPHVFDFPYPIFDEEYRETLETKILRHFYTREIGQETVGLWKLQLSIKLNDIMPYYNQLYASTVIEFDPMTDVNYEHSGTDSMSISASASETGSNANSLSTSESGSTSSSSEGSMWDLYQDTPQNGLIGVDTMQYLTNADRQTNNGRTSASDVNAIASHGNGSFQNQNIKAELDRKDYLERYKGYRSNNPSKLLSDFRDTFLNIDLMIIGELEKLFFQLW